MLVGFGLVWWTRVYSYELVGMGIVDGWGRCVCFCFEKEILGLNNHTEFVW
jgi:hypothetical protein